MCSSDLLDHVHPQIAVHAALAAALYDTLSLDDDAIPRRPVDDHLAAEVRGRILSRISPADHVDALVTLAMTLAWAGKNDEALRLCDACLEKMPSHTGAARIRGRMLQKLDRHDEALEQLEAAARLAPTDSQLLAALADEYGRRGEYPVAASCLERAIEHTPDRAPASFRRMLHLRLAECCRLLGDERRARQQETVAAEVGN